MLIQSFIQFLLNCGFSIQVTVQYYTPPASFSWGKVGILIKCGGIPCYQLQNGMMSTCLRTISRFAIKDLKNF